MRKRLPDERVALTHKFSVAGHEIYVIVGLFPDGTPGEVFLHSAKQGSTLNGFCDGLALLLSLALQHGVPLQTIVDKFRNTHFAPFGCTSNPDIPEATSVLDYLGRWLERKFLADPAQLKKDEPAATLDPCQKDVRPAEGEIPLPDSEVPLPLDSPPGNY